MATHTTLNLQETPQASIVGILQGSAIGPVSYVVNASDMHTISPYNALFQSADDTYLIVPSVNSSTFESEIEHVND